MELMQEKSFYFQFAENGILSFAYFSMKKLGSIEGFETSIFKITQFSNTYIENTFLK